jgi:hypothetical protein
MAQFSRKFLTISHLFTFFNTVNRCNPFPDDKTGYLNIKKRAIIATALIKENVNIYYRVKIILLILP